MYTNVNTTHYTIVYRCQGCLAWNQNGATATQDTTGAIMLIGWAQNYENMDDPSNPNSTYEIQHDAQDIMLYFPASATQSSYSAWATHSTIPVSTGTATATTATTTTTSVVGTPAPTNTYDYIVVGAGAGGLPLADKLSESGKSVLLIERGPPSSYRWGGRNGPDWLTTKTNATRFDVPGLDNEIWNNSAGIACSDVSQMSGCVLGGGTVSIDHC